MQKLKKASSEIIATILIIAIIIAAITFLYISVKKINLSMSPELSCFEMQENSIIIINKACYNSTSKEIEINLRRSSENFYLKSLEFSLDNTTYTCKNECANCYLLDAGTSMTYYLDAEQKSNNIKLIANECRIGSIKIADC